MVDAIARFDAMTSGSEKKSQAGLLPEIQTISTSTVSVLASAALMTNALKQFDANGNPQDNPTQTTGLLQAVPAMTPSGTSPGQQLPGSAGILTTDGK
jgi:hypothetical protein